jgi:hypothetical protein
MVKKLYSSKSKSKKELAKEDDPKRKSLLDFIDENKTPYSLNPGDSNSDSQKEKT